MALVKPFVYLAVVATVCSGLSACRTNHAISTKPPTPFISPVLTTAFESPINNLFDGIPATTAFQSYEIARAKAHEWNANAVWHGIMPSSLMERNFGIPASGGGWFFRFGLQENSLEYHVQVKNGEVSGTTEAQPILMEPLPYELMSIDINELVVDSTQVLEIFWENDGDQYLKEHPESKLNYRLLHIKGLPNPVWSLFDSADLNNSLINIDARTGAIVDDPFESME